MTETDTTDWGITYSGVRNPRWANTAQTEIQCEVNWDHVNDEVWSPCLTIGSGDRNYIHEIYNKCVAGEFGAVGAYVRPDDIPASHDGRQPAKDYFIREERNRLLAETDHLMLSDNWNSLTSEKQTEWTNYRAALRAMPNDSAYNSLVGVYNDTNGEYEPSVTITWPTKPS